MTSSSFFGYDQLSILTNKKILFLKNMPHFWGGEQHFFVCPDRNLKFSASFWFRISWNITKFQLSMFTNKNVLSKKKWGMLVIETLKCKIHHSNTCFSSRLYGTYSHSKNLTSPFPLIFLSKHISLYALGRSKWILDIIWPIIILTENQRNLLKQV